jgi:hypothetical protein
MGGSAEEFAGGLGGGCWEEPVAAARRRRTAAIFFNDCSFETRISGGPGIFPGGRKTLLLCPCKFNRIRASGSGRPSPEA